MKKYSTFLVLLILSTNCSKQESSSENTVQEDPVTYLKKESVTGHVQKGPFISGTGIFISELNEDLSQTGKWYNTSVSSNEGTFEIENIQFISDYVAFKANGFYFNEVLGKKSDAPIDLYALSDLSDNSTVNINLLSHLEKARVEYLVSDGMDFASAKETAQSEILDIFGFAFGDAENSEALNFLQNGPNNAQLLAISILLQGYRTEAELTELLSTISLDLKEDGVLDNTALGSQIMNHAPYLKSSEILGNIQQKLSELGIDSNLPDFGEYLDGFIENAGYPITHPMIQYPETGEHGPNLLALPSGEYNLEAGDVYSVRAIVTKPVRFKLKLHRNVDEFNLRLALYNVDGWQNHFIGSYDSEYYDDLTREDDNLDGKLELIYGNGDGGSFTCTVYENNEETPLKTITVSW